MSKMLKKEDPSPQLADRRQQLIQVRNLKKTFRILNKKPGIKGAVGALFSTDYKKIEAVKEISFDINRGDIVGYVGPNGAGKSTTIKMLIGILHPDSGSVIVNGLNPFKQRKQFAKQIGVMFGQKSQLWWDLPLRESFDLLKSIDKIDKIQYNRNIDFFSEVLDIKNFWNQPVRRLSLGQRVRSDLAAALLHDPAVLFLDEPTIGLDLVARSNFRQLIRKINSEKQITVLITSHDLDDIEALAERLMLIDKGSLMFNGRLDEFMHSYTTYSYVKILFSRPPDTLEALLPENVSCRMISEDQAELKFLKGEISYAGLLKNLSSIEDIKDIQSHSPDLEQILERIYRNNDVPEVDL